MLARYVSAGQHPLRVFAALEAAIGGCGALLIVVMPLVGRLYTAVDGGGPSSVLLRALASLLLLLPPAMLMGATLPAMSRYVEATSAGAARLGLFYGANILGAVIGCLSAGFYLLRWFHLASASLAAVFLNAAVAISAFSLARRTPYAPQRDTSTERDAVAQNAAPDGGSWEPRGVYAAIALSGFTALGAEVVWTRLLSLLFGATTYTFSIFSLCSWRDSAPAARLARHSSVPRPVPALFWVGCRSACLSPSPMAHGWRRRSSRTGPSIRPWHRFPLDFQTDLYRTLLTMLPSAVLWGLSFPLAVSAAIRPKSDAGAAVGRVYAANTFGAIAGAVLTPLVFIPLVGTHGAQRLLIVASAISAGVVLLPLFGSSTGRTTRNTRRALGSGAMFGLALLMTGAVVAAATVSHAPAGLVAWGRLF